MELWYLKLFPAMKEIHYEFRELDDESSFRSFGEFFKGTLKDQTLCFDNEFGKGQLTRLEADKGLWIRKWSLNVHQNIILHKLPSGATAEKKFGLVYFLNPHLFDLKGHRKKIKCNSHHNNLFYCNAAKLDFSVTPGKPFYAIDIAFTASWLIKQLTEALDPYKKGMNQFLRTNREIVLMQPCIIEDYKTLHELELSDVGEQDPLFIRSRVYKLVTNFFYKSFSPVKEKKEQYAIQYEKIMKVAGILTENPQKCPDIQTIASEVNMSISSLLRQFKLIYGKGINEYFLEYKMELAKKIMCENRITVKAVAYKLGYKQASPFIERFTKHHGFSPGKIAKKFFE